MTPAFEDLRQGDFVKARVGNERLWFQVLSHCDDPPNAVVCTVASAPVAATFDGRVTLDREWILETQRSSKPDLRVVN